MYKYISLLFFLFFSQKMGYCLNFVETYLNLTEDDIKNTVKNFDIYKVPEENVKFLFYPPGSNETKDITFHDALETINFNNPTKMVIHGFTEHAKKPWIQEMASYYHEKGCNNVIAVDWSINAVEPYEDAVAYTKSVGSIIGEFLLNILKENPRFLENLHLIAFSLGGHVAGFAGKRVAKSRKNRLVEKITGLDVASPIFESPNKLKASLRLDKSDARFVDLIHTNVGMFGVEQRYGHVDFFVNNGGPIQPMCVSKDLRAAVFCSHQSSHEFFAQTILNPKKYRPGVLCGDARNNTNCNDTITALMGDGASHYVRGGFLVKIDPSTDM